MTTSPGGFAGKILRVNLSTKETTEQRTDPATARLLLGGVGLGSKVLYDEVGPGVEPLGPDNVVVVAVGPLTGTAAPCCSRVEVTTKSPLTGIYGSSSCGGTWAATLKHAGYDAVVVRGQAQEPVYLYISDGHAEIRDASHVWGKDTWETTDTLTREIKTAPPDVRVMAIGSAGERLVRFACLITEHYHSASRAGAGAVMGAKKLKAIAVRGTGSVPLADETAFREAAKEATDLILTNPYHQFICSVNSLYNLEEYEKRGSLAGKNFQTGVLPGFASSMGLDSMKKYLGRKVGTCYRCPMSCFDLAEVNEGKYAGLKISSATFVAAINSFGAKCAVPTLPAIWKCKEVAHRLGMDIFSASGVIAWAMEMYQRGILTKSDTGGMELAWGDADAVVELMHQIARREGLGNVLAEGTERAAREIGRGSEKRVCAIKGLDMAASDPRSGKTGWSLGYILSPRGGDNVATMHAAPFEVPREKWPAEKYDMPPDMREKIYGAQGGTGVRAFDGKAALVRWVYDLCSALSASGFCIFPATRLVALGPTQCSKMLSAATGWEMTPQEFMRVGERIASLQRAYSVREGITRRDDDWPERFYTEPLPEGPSKGAVLNRQAVNRALDDYYALRGWDRATGIPTETTLRDLGLADVAADLRKSGNLPG